MITNPKEAEEDGHVCRRGAVRGHNVFRQDVFAVQVGNILTNGFGAFEGITGQFEGSELQSCFSLRRLAGKSNEVVEREAWCRAPTKDIFRLWRIAFEPLRMLLSV